VSVTLLSPIKTVKARITKSSPWTAPRTLVFCDEMAISLKSGYFTAIGSFSVKMVADRHRYAAFLVVPHFATYILKVVSDKNVLVNRFVGVFYLFINLFLCVILDVKCF